MGRNPQADLLEPDINGDTPLHVYIGEVRKHRVELLITILSSIRDIDVNRKNTDGHTPLHIAAMVTYTHTVEHLYKECTPSVIQYSAK